MTNNTDPTVLYTTAHYEGVYPNRRYVNTDVRKGDQLPLGILHPGTQIELNGDAAVLMHSYHTNSLVRLHTTQDVVLVSKSVPVTVTDFSSRHEALPQRGTIIEVRKGKYAGRLAVVAAPGLNSAHIIVPGVSDEVKIGSKNMIVRDDASIKV